MVQGSFVVENGAPVLLERQIGKGRVLLPFGP